MKSANTKNVNPEQRVYIRGFGVYPSGLLIYIHPRLYSRGFLWFGVKCQQKTPKAERILTFAICILQCCIHQIALGDLVNTKNRGNICLNRS